MSTFRAIRIDKAEKATTAAFVDFDDAELMEGDVDIRVSHSSLTSRTGWRSPASRLSCAVFR